MLPNKKTKLNMVILLTAMSVLLPAMAPGIEAPCVDPPSDLVSWWPGDGHADDIWSDNHGTLINGATFAPGKVNRAFSFDGVNDYVNIQNTTGINLGIHDERTVDAWFNVNDKTISTRKQVIYEEGGYVRGLNIYVYNGLLYVGGWNNPSDESNWIGTYLISDNNEIESGKWHHIALVLDGNSALEPNVFRAYLDGVLFGSGSGSQLWAHNPAVIGAIGFDTQFHDGDFAGTGHWFGGLIDEVEIFNRALSASEIQAIYNAGSAGKCKPCVEPPSDLVSWWPGDGDADDIWSDNDGTLMNGATFAPGKVGQAFSFDGVNDFVEVPDSDSLDTGTQFTIDAWFKTDNVWKIDPGTNSPSQAIVMHGWYPANGKTTLLLIRDGKLGFVIRGYGGLYEDLVGVTPIYKDTWYLAVITYDGTTATLYLNGAVEDSQAAAMNLNTDSRVTIGRHQNPKYFNINFHFDGLIDEVEIFNRALSASEIQAIFAAGSAGKCKIDPVGDLQDLTDLIDSLDPGDFSNPNKQNALVNKVNAIINGLDLNDVVSICDAIDKLTNDILRKTDGDTPPPDWVTDPTAQQELEDAVNDIIDTLQDIADSLGGC